MASVSPPLNCITALESIVVLAKPKSSKVGNCKAEILGELIFVGYSNGALISESFSVFFLKLENTSGMSLIEKGKSSAWYNVLVLIFSNSQRNLNNSSCTFFSVCLSSKATSRLANTFCALHWFTILGISISGFPF